MGALRQYLWISLIHYGQVRLRQQSGLSARGVAGPTYLQLTIGVVLIAVDRIAQKYGIPRKVREPAQLVLVDVPRGIPELAVELLAVDFDELVEELVLGGAIGLREGIAVEAAVSVSGLRLLAGRKASASPGQYNLQQEARLATLPVSHEHKAQLPAWAHGHYGGPGRRGRDGGRAAGRARRRLTAVDGGAVK